jgi:hypothetical protein
MPRGPLPAKPAEQHEHHHSHHNLGITGTSAYFENPGSRNPSPASVSKYSVDTSKSTSDAGPNPA